MWILPARLLRLAAALACALAGGIGTAAAQAVEGTVIKDPHYGDSLFSFYQQRYFTSLTGLMVSQHFDRVASHADEAEILRGGLFLSYGLHREAGEVFARLIDQSTSPKVRDRAWFYLAKIRYQRGIDAQAEEAIARIGGELPPALEEDRVLLHANLLMRRGDYAAAAETLGRATSKASQYARFNLGVALIKSGDSAGGTKLLDELGRFPAASEEARGLRDRANVALGFAALQEGRPEQARIYLERVRLSGLHSNKALLGFGWAAAELKQPKLALVPWAELAGRDRADAAVLEARLAVPYAYGELGAHGQALQLYRQAIDFYDEEGAALDDSVAAIRGGRLIEALLAANPDDELGWLTKVDKLPEMPHAGHLADVLAEHAFQEGFKDLRDLLFLERNLQQWRATLSAFRDMLAHRRAAFAERLPQAQTQERALGVPEFEQRAAALAAEVQRIETQADVAGLGDSRERALAARLDGVFEILKRLPDDDATATLRRRAERATGALLWQQTQRYPERLWQAKKGMQEIATMLERSQLATAALAQAQRDEPARFDAFAGRIDELERRIDQMLPRTAELARAQQQRVQEIAVAALQRNKARLLEYASQARFAVAQIHDRAYLAEDARRAPVQ
jgi:hypothetical protein